MQYEGFLIHDSSCSAIKEKAYDFWISNDASIMATSLPTDSRYIHIYLEGYFNKGYELMSANEKHQLFTASKLIMQLSSLYRISPLHLQPHSQYCPGSDFPWNQLVIFPADMYH